MDTEKKKQMDTRIKEKEMDAKIKESQEFIDKQKNLIEAIREQNIELVRKLVQSFDNTEIKIHDECAHENADDTALTRASYDGSTEIVAILIRAGFNVDYESYRGTPLYIACKYGNVEIVRLLTNANCTLNKGWCMYTPLYIATEYGPMCVNEKLIYTPLYTASEYGHTDVVEQLILAANVRNEGLSSSDIVDALEVACSEGHTDIVDKLLGAANVRNEGLSSSDIVNALEEACSGGHGDIVDKLLGAGCTKDIFLKADEMMKSPMWAAVKNGHEEIVQQLIDAGFDINTAPTDGRCYLWIAISRGHENIVLKLLKAGFDPNIRWRRRRYTSPRLEYDYTPLFLAINIRIEHWSIGGGQNNMPLSLAIKYLGIIRKLVDFDYNVNFYTLISPLYNAAINGEHEIVCVLLQAGADKENKNRQGCFSHAGETPLHGAVQSGVQVVVQTLIDAGCDINSRIDAGSDIHNGETPVFIAAKNGNVEIVNILLAHGCDIEIPRTDGFTPLDVAIQENKQDVVRILYIFKKVHFQNLYLAFAMSAQTRLGFASSSNQLNYDLRKQIFDQAEIFHTGQEQLRGNDTV